MRKINCGHFNAFPTGAIALGQTTEQIMEHGYMLGLCRSKKVATQTGGTVELQNIVAPTFSGSPVVGQSLLANPGTWAGQGSVSFAFQWRRNGTDITGATAASYTIVAADDVTDLSCEVTATDDLTSVSAFTSDAYVTQPLPSFTIQPSLSPLNAQVGATFTINEGAAGPDATLSITQFTLDGVDERGALNGLDWDSSAKTPGDLVLQVSATNSGGTVLSNLSGAVLEAANTVPAQPSAGSWSLSDPATGGTLNVLVTGLPNDGGMPILSIEYQVDGGAWQSSGLSGTGNFDITALTDNQSYSVNLRAVNAIGNGASSAAKTGTPTTLGAGQEVARFGTTNTAGSAPYDTLGAAADGNYGAFTVSGGVITMASPAAAGNYNVGGYPVAVSANDIAVSTQSEFNNLSNADIGKTIIVRKGARLVWNQVDASDFGYHTDMQHGKVLGDGGDCRVGHTSAGNDADAHFDYIKFKTCANITLENLKIVPTNPSSSGSCFEFLEASGGGHLQHDVTLLRCVFKTSSPSAYGNYSSGGFPGKHGILCQANIPIKGVCIQDSVFYGNRRAIELPATGQRYVEIVGNLVDMNYEDFIKINAHSGQTPVLLAGNYCTRPLSLGSDSGNPHTDILQLQGGTGSDANILLEANFFFSGDARGKNAVQVWYLGGNSGSGISGLIRGCGNVDASLRSYNPGKTNGFRTEYSATIPNDSKSLPFGGAEAGHRYDGGVTSAGSQLHHCFFGDYLDNGYHSNISVTACNKVKQWSAATLTSRLPAYPIAATDGPYTMSEFIDLFEPQSGTPLDGRGPWPMVSLAAGEEHSNFVLDATLVPAPVLSGLSVSPSSSSFSATVQTTVDLNPIYWAVVPQGTSVTDYNAIKKRRIPGALDYGFATVGINQTGSNIAISGSGGSLSGSTTYQLVLFQENGWTRRSAILTSTFSTS